jgi:hypothetical protein
MMYILAMCEKRSRLIYERGNAPITQALSIGRRLKVLVQSGLHLACHIGVWAYSLSLWDSVPRNYKGFVLLVGCELGGLQPEAMGSRC